MAKYIIDESYLDKYREEIGQGQPMRLEVMEADTLCWLVVRAIISLTKMEGSDTASLYNFIKGEATGNECFIRVLEELGDEEELPVARDPFSSIPKVPR